jgi:hypothetical protein
MTYQDTASQIIKDSIKSAIFIDENAWESFSPEPIGIEFQSDNQRSAELYRKFKEEGISLSTYKFTTVKDVEINKNYLFDRRDLVLLDWKLADTSGEEFSLKILSKIIELEYIHFCVIYTSSPEKDFDTIFKNILAYFSNGNRTDYDDLRFRLSDIEDEIPNMMSKLELLNIERDSETSKELVAQLFKEHTNTVKRIKEEACLYGDLKCALIKTGIAFSNYIKSDEILPCPSVISFNNRSLVIGNTLVTILNKDDNKPSELIDNFSTQIVRSEYSFMQLLGLEMQRIFSLKAAFIDSSILHVSKEAFIHHRNQKMVKDDEVSFKQFVKEVLFEQAKLNLRDEELKLLNSEQFETSTPIEISTIKESEILAMNVFYNSSILKGERRLNFGDVFKFEERYFICITALCDCLNPNKNVFYFSEGEKIKNIDEALSLGDTAFISYLPDKRVIRWSDLPPKGEDQILHKYKPVYIKPISYIIPINIITENKLKFHFLKEDATLDSFEVEYITTIKTDYAQRIANHAFSYPIRVGIDFVKKSKS